jgi:hypothetical protein
MASTCGIATGSHHKDLYPPAHACSRSPPALSFSVGGWRLAACCCARTQPCACSFRGWLTLHHFYPTIPPVSLPDPVCYCLHLAAVLSKGGCANVILTTHSDSGTWWFRSPRYFNISFLLGKKIPFGVCFKTTVAYFAQVSLNIRKWKHRMLVFEA